MATLYNDNVMRGGDKIGYYSGTSFYDLGGRKMGYYDGTSIYDETGTQMGYVSGSGVYRADGTFYDNVEKTIQHVSNGNYSEMPCAAVCLLFGWD